MRRLFSVRRALPLNCIYIKPPKHNRTPCGAERYAKVYNIDYNRCIFTGIVWRRADRRLRMGAGLRLRRSMRGFDLSQRADVGQRIWEQTRFQPRGRGCGSAGGSCARELRFNKLNHRDDDAPALGGRRLCMGTF
jgi:hypothetical protein